MRKAELDEIRAIVRAQALEAPAPARKGLLGGVASLLKKSPDAGKRPPLNLTPPQPATVEIATAPERVLEPLDLRAGDPPAVGETDAPMLFLAPKRARFGLADEGGRPEVELRLSFKATSEVDHGFEAAIEIQPRRPGAGLAATEAAGIGEDEILELYEMLSERMPALLTQIDLDAKLESSAPPPILDDQPVLDDQPSIADVVAAVEAARSMVERAAVGAAWAETATVLSTLGSDRSSAAVVRRRRLARLHAEMSSHHAELEGDLGAMRRARSPRRVA